MRDRIAALRDRLSPAEARVAALVMAEPGRVTGSNLAAVARAAGVSEPTVIRFCRSLGLGGFSELRLALVRAEGGTAPAREVVIGMPPAEASGAGLDAAIAGLVALRRGLDPAALHRGLEPGALHHDAALLLAAERVEIWGDGEAAPVAEAVGQRLFGLCRGVVVRTDPRMRAAAAMGLEAGAVVLCLGEAPVAAGEAQVIVLDAPPPVAGLAGPMARRVALLALGEALALAVLLQAPPAVRERAARMAAAGGAPGWQGPAGRL